MAQGLLGGVLPAIFSGADQLKRGVYGLLTNPQEQAQRAAQSLLQSHAERQALMGQAFANPDRPFQVTNQAALGQLGTDVLTGELGIAPVGMTKLESVITPYIQKGVNLDVYQSSNNPNKIVLSRIEVPKNQRNTGIGTDVMNDLSRLADDEGKIISLSPSTDFGGTSVSRLKDFYKKFGFVENKGRNKDYSISDTMYRNPQTAQQGLLGDNNLTSIYHGTDPKAAKAIEKSGFDINKSADGTIWFTSNPEIGEVAATGKGAVVQRYLDENKVKLGGWDEIDKFSVDELIQKGYDGVKLQDETGTVFQIFNPEKLNK